MYRILVAFLLSIYICSCTTSVENKRVTSLPLVESEDGLYYHDPFGRYIIDSKWVEKMKGKQLVSFISAAQITSDDAFVDWLKGQRLSMFSLRGAEVGEESLRKILNNVIVSNNSCLDARVKGWSEMNGWGDMTNDVIKRWKLVLSAVNGKSLIEYQREVK